MTEKTIHENGHDPLCGLYGIDPEILRGNDYSDECGCTLIRSVRKQYVGPDCICSSCTKDRDSDGDPSVGWHLEYLEDGIKDAERELTNLRASIAAEVRNYPRDICCCPHDDPCEGDYAGCAACWDLPEDTECFGGTHRHVAAIILAGGT